MYNVMEVVWEVKQESPWASRDEGVLWPESF